MRPFIKVEELHSRHDPKHTDHHYGHGRSTWGVKEGKGHFLDVIEDQLGGIRRSTLSQDEQMVDQFDRVDHGIDRN